MLIIKPMQQMAFAGTQYTLRCNLMPQSPGLSRFLTMKCLAGRTSSRNRERLENFWAPASSSSPKAIGYFFTTNTWLAVCTSSAQPPPKSLRLKWPSVSAVKMICFKTAYSHHLTAHEYLRRMTGDPSAKISIGHEVRKSRK